MIPINDLLVIVDNRSVSERLLQRLRRCHAPKPPRARPKPRSRQRVVNAPPVGFTTLPSPELILQEVADFYGLHDSDILGARRFAEIVWPRWMVCLLLREVLAMSLPQIGRFINQHHTTVLSALQCVPERMKADPELRAEVDEISRRVAAKATVPQ